MKKLCSVLTAVVLISSAHAYAEPREVVHAERNGTVVRSTDGECVRTKWMKDTDECASAVVQHKVVETQQIVQKPAPPPAIVTTLSREDRTVYFGFNQASLSPQMQQRLDTLANVAGAQTNVRGAHVYGYADRIGNPSYNEKLSQKRAQAVRGYLAARGLLNAQAGETRWFGESEPATNCPDSLKRPQLIDCLQKDRRVEVEIDYATQTQATR